MSESDSEPERASSVGSVKPSYDHVPEDLNIKVKVYNAGGEREAKFLYPLTKGRKLPARIQVNYKDKKVMQLTFSKNRA